MSAENLSLYECSEIIAQIENLAEAQGGVVSDPDMERLVKAQLTSIEKLTKLVRYVKYLEGWQDLAKAEVDRIYKQKTIFANRVESIKRFLLPYIQENGPQNIGLNRISTRKSEAVVVDEGFKNLDYCKVVTTTTPDKPKIKESIRAGIEIEGCKIEERIHIQIK
jgi:hypothetical protein